MNPAPPAARAAAAPLRPRRAPCAAVILPEPPDPGAPRCVAALEAVLGVLRGLARGYRACAAAEPAREPLLAALRRACAQDMGDLRLAAASCGIQLGSRPDEHGEEAEARDLAGLLAAERRLLTLYLDAIAEAEGRRCVRNALRRQLAARRPQIHALDAVAAAQDRAHGAVH